jgi:hypothetical protein
MKRRTESAREKPFLSSLGILGNLATALAKKSSELTAFSFSGDFFSTFFAPLGSILHISFGRN